MHRILSILYISWIVGAGKRTCDSRNTIDCSNLMLKLVHPHECQNIVVNPIVSNTININKTLKTCNVSNFYLNDNNFTTLADYAFNGLHITNLYLYFNSLSELRTNSFGGMAPLKVLSLHHNKIETLHESAVPDVAEIYLNYNSIREINQTVFANIRSLKKLILDHNQITRMQESALNGLKLDVIVLDYNRIEYLDRKSVPVAKNVSIRSNDLTVISSAAFVDMASTEVLDVYANKIFEIADGTFKNSNIRKLNLKYNKLRNLTTHTFQAMYFLKYLDLADNRITHIELKTFPRVKLLSLANNLVEVMDSRMFTDVPYLEFLNLTNNCIDTVDNMLKPKTNLTHRRDKRCMGDELKIGYSFENLGIIIITTIAVLVFFAIIIMIKILLRTSLSTKWKAIVFCTKNITSTRSEAPGTGQACRTFCVNETQHEASGTLEHIYEEINEKNEPIYNKENDIYEFAK